MTMKKRILSLIMVFCLCITACSKISIPTNSNAAFENYTHCLFQQEVASNTINLHYSLQNPEKHGIIDAPITLGSYDFDPITSLSMLENWETGLKKFSYNHLSKKNQLTYDILSHYFTSLKVSANYYLYQEPLTPVTGIHAQLPILLAEYSFTCREDADTYLALLQTLPDYFASLSSFEQLKSEKGLFMSDELADEVIEQCHDFVSMGKDNYLLSTFEERIKHLEASSELDSAPYIQKNRDCIFSHVVPAYEALALSISSLKGTGGKTKGLCHLPEGKDYYKHLVAQETGSSRSIAKLQTLIRTQISSDLSACQKIILENPDIPEETYAVTESPERILQNLQGKIRTAFPNSAEVNVNIKYVPHALEEHLSPAFYLIPAIDNYTDNTIYINPAYGLNDIDLFTTLAHEGYPGHLYQTTYFANTNPDPIRSLLSCTGYVEGWATYAEMSSYYISNLEKPHATLLQKNNSLILGLYALADIGIHHDGWLLDETIKHFQSYGIADETIIRDIFKHISGNPANYLTYYIGYLEILELKKERISKEGNSFSQKAFHQKLLEIGPAPFEIIRKHYDK